MFMVGFLRYSNPSGITAIKFTANAIAHEMILSRKSPPPVHVLLVVTIIIKLLTSSRLNNWPALIKHFQLMKNASFLFYIGTRHILYFFYIFTKYFPAGTYCNIPHTFQIKWRKRSRKRNLVNTF